MRTPNPFSVKSSVRKSFSDLFQRSNTEDGLGITADGSRWDLVRGIFRILGNKAVSNTSPDEYPIATVTMPYEDVEISLDDIDNGVGAALWVSDAGDWWGIALEQEEVDCNCSVGTECNRWNQGGLCTTWNSPNCNRWNDNNCRNFECASWNAAFSFFTCNSFTTRCVEGVCCFPAAQCTRWVTECASGSNTFVESTCNSFRCARWNSRNCRSFNSPNCTTWTVETCNRWNEFAFDCETCYPQWVRVLQSVNSTVTTVTRFLITKTFRTESSPQGGLSLFVQDTFIDKIVRGIKIFTQGNNIQADTYHELNFQDKVDVEETVIYNATGATITPAYGIMVNPSSYNQNNFIGSIEIEKNS